jgi:rhamnosyl/mannosyltransferase
MKILHIGKYFSPFKGGLESYMRDAMAALARRGVECAALVHRHDLAIKNTDELFETDDTRFRIVRAGVLFKLSYTPVSPCFPFLLDKLLREFQPNILHIHMPNPSAIWALTSSRAKSMPWVVHWHADVVTSSFILKFFYFMYRPFEQLILKRAAAIVVTSAAYRDSSEPLKGVLHKCHVVPLGIDDKHFKSNSGTGLSAISESVRTELQVLAIGRLTYYKGFKYLIEAAAMAKSAKIYIIGTGNEEENLKSLAARLGLENRVVFHGALTDQELVHKIEQCDCVCLPSIERTEAFGVVLLEAMCFAKATVVCDVPGSGMGWIVEDGITGIKVAPANSRSLANALDYLAENREVLISMGQQGKQRFDQEFTIDHSILSMIEIYRQSLASNEYRDE